MMKFIRFVDATRRHRISQRGKTIIGWPPWACRTLTSSSCPVARWWWNPWPERWWGFWRWRRYRCATISERRPCTRRRARSRWTVQLLIGMAGVFQEHLGAPKNSYDNIVSTNCCANSLLNTTSRYITFRFNSLKWRILCNCKEAIRTGII